MPAPRCGTPAPGRADLHTHTTASDGLLRPEQLVRLAAQRGLVAIAITDHDTMDGALDARALDVPGILIVTGVELSCSREGEDVHILGYGVDPLAPELGRLLIERGDERRLRAVTIVERLAGLGVTVSIERVSAIAGAGTIGRPHVARALVEAGYVASVGEAFDRFLASGRPAYIDRPVLTPERAIRAIHGAGGSAVLAHPLYSPGYVDFLPALVEAGLDGLEVIYPDHNGATQRRLAALAASYGLVATGGSDFHADAGQPGHGLGESTVLVDIVDQLAERATRRQSTGATS